jgi:hypothetical protein
MAIGAFRDLVARYESLICNRLQSEHQIAARTANTPLSDILLLLVQRGRADLAEGAIRRLSAIGWRITPR